MRRVGGYREKNQESFCHLATTQASHFGCTPGILYGPTSLPNPPQLVKPQSLRWHRHQMDQSAVTRLPRAQQVGYWRTPPGLPQWAHWQHIGRSRCRVVDASTGNLFPYKVL